MRRQPKRSGDPGRRRQEGGEAVRTAASRRSPTESLPAAGRALPETESEAPVSSGNRPSYAALIALSCTLAACSAARNHQSNEDQPGGSGSDIVGGTPATSYPEAVLVDLSQGGQVTAACSGSLIAPQVVMTAGHCVVTFDGWT